MVPAANNPPYRIVSLKVVVRHSSLNRIKHVTDTAFGANEGACPGGVDFFSQPADVDVDQVGAGIEVIFPDVLENHPPCEQLTGVAHHELEQLEFHGQQLDPAAT